MAKRPRKSSSRISATGATFIQASRRIPASDKANWHQNVGTGRSRTRRPFLGITNDDERELQGMIDRWNMAASDKEAKA